MRPGKNTRGFTLVELAIVLVIIGLLVGGVLVGQDLIKQAEVKAAAAQLEKFNLGAAAFRTKYGALPGDITPEKASNFSFLARAGTDGRGDADGALENFNVAANKGGLGSETALFWRDLSDARMISQGFSAATDAIVDSSGWTAPATNQLRTYLPKSTLRDAMFIHIYAGNGTNYYNLAVFSSGAATGVITWADGLSPTEALGLDRKIDDGRPLQGIVRPTTAQNVLDTGGAAGPTQCVDTGPTIPIYNTTTTDYANGLTCQLRVRAAF